MAGTYIKLQDAYASEANAIGGWKKIGYVAPGATKAGDTGNTTNFTYTGSVTADATIAIDGANQADAWKASNKVALNECAPNTGNWAVKVIGNSNGNSLSYDATTGCDELTPSFTKIGK